MSTYDSVMDTDSSWVWRFAIISIAWLALFAIASVLLILFREPIAHLFFG